MTNIEETTKLAVKAIQTYLSESDVTSAAETQLALSKLVAVATQSVEIVIDHESALDMLNGVRTLAESRYKVESIQNTLVMATPSSIQ